MPTVFEQGPDNVIVWINSGGAVDAASQRGAAAGDLRGA
jgi:hypothetical protein